MSEQRTDMHNDTDGAIPAGRGLADPKNADELTQYVTLVLQQMQDRFQIMSEQIMSRIDEMGNRVDDLERNIADLMAQSAPEENDK